MARVLMVSVAEEGGLYSPDKNDAAPIRIYSDRWVEDDIAAKFTGRRRRNRLSRNEYSKVRRAARNNRACGVV